MALNTDQWMTAFSIQPAAGVYCEGCVGMTKKPLRHVVGLLFAGLIAAVGALGLLELGDGSGVSVAGIVAISLLSLLLVYGIEIEYLRYGEFELRFSGDDDE